MTSTIEYKPLHAPMPPARGEQLDKDEIGYNFNQKLMLFDPLNMAQIRPDPRDSRRKRCLAILQRFLAFEPERLSYGITGEVIPWRKIQREQLYQDHFPTAVALREWSRVAPRDRLGIDHTYRLLHRWGYLHTFKVHCNWDLQPFVLDVQGIDPLDPETQGPDKPIATIRSRIFKSTPYYQMESPQQEILGYVDAIVPRNVSQIARVRDDAHEPTLIGTIHLTRPTSDDEQRLPFEADIYPGEDQQPAAIFKEGQVGSRHFYGRFYDTLEEVQVGLVDDRLDKGQVVVRCELDLPLDKRLILGAITNFAELSRLRKAGWPDRPEDREEEYFTDITAELGPRRRG